MHPLWPRARSCPTPPARPSPKSCTSTPGSLWPTFSRPTCASTPGSSTITCGGVKISPPAGWTAASPGQPSTRWLRKRLTTHRPPPFHRPMLRLSMTTLVASSNLETASPTFRSRMPSATAMKYNPRLKVMLSGGYFDLATPYFAARYEMSHLPIPANLRQNIEFSWYQSGHMVYLHEDSLKQLHDRVAAFITSTYKPVK